MAPKFGLDDGSTSNFDATLVLATMLVSQLHGANPPEHPPAAETMHQQTEHASRPHVQPARSTANVSDHPSDHTKIWSELSGSFLL